MVRPRTSRRSSSAAWLATAENRAGRQRRPYSAQMTTRPSADLIHRAPKALLHDHLDGGLRPQTVLDLAQDSGYGGRLPAQDAPTLARWFRDSADSGSLELYLETFSHTVAVMQTADQLHRVARECALDLAADGVVYAESRFAPELHLDGGLSLDAVVDAVLAGFRDGEREAAARAPRYGWSRCSPRCGTRPTAPRSLAWPCSSGTVVSAAYVAGVLAPKKLQSPTGPPYS